MRPVHVRPDLGSADLGDYDVIYAISVLSHLNEANSVSMLRLLGDSLRLDGIALFTSHGRTSLDDPGLYGSEFAARRDEIAVEVEQNGMAFVPYAFTGSDDYGMAWHATAWVEETMRDLHGSRDQADPLRSRGSRRPSGCLRVPARRVAAARSAVERTAWTASLFPNRPATRFTAEGAGCEREDPGP